MRSIPAFGLLLTLAPLLTTACTSIRTTEDDSSLAAATAILSICKDAWKDVSYSSSKDTQQTVDEVRSQNRARKAFCHD